MARLAVEGVGNLQDAGRAFLFAVIDVAMAGVGQDFKRDGREGEAAQCLGADGVGVEVLEVLEHGSFQLSGSVISALIDRNGFQSNG